MNHPRYPRFLLWRLPAKIAAIEALFWLVISSLAIRVLPFRMATRLAGSVGAENERGLTANSTVRMCCWFVDRWGDRLPWRAVCFQKGLALQMMLRRRGVASRLHYGVAQGKGRALRSHVWVTVGETIVLGGETASEFACLASYPPAGGRAA